MSEQERAKIDRFIAWLLEHPDKIPAAEPGGKEIAAVYCRLVIKVILFITDGGQVEITCRLKLCF